jgi:phosphohistidine swiveling domain-containing protein
MEWTYSLDTIEEPDLAAVGGKAMSLIHMTQGGYSVPPGFVLTVAFFEPWLGHVQDAPEWNKTLSGRPDELRQNTIALQKVCAGLELDESHRQALSEALSELQADEDAALLAVRSSSPEEDLEAASFAGGYRTILGVKPQDVEDAVRQSFASAFDERVFVYKREHGFDVNQPHIAVIVQKQIAADSSGVAFSLNPLNNCYDEAVVNANFGLGESVVSGMASPDSFTVDKVSRTILERKIGTKETSIWLDSDGGTYHEPSPSCLQACLSDDQILALTDVVADLERDFGKPIDVEWAFSDGQLHLLQARPITAYYQLPEVMVTAPGEPKRLYADLTLTKWGMQQPVSVMGTDLLGILNQKMMEYTMGKGIGTEATEFLRVSAEGRTYVAISTSMKLQGKSRVATEFGTMDSLTAEIIENIDETEYMPKTLPPALKGLLFKAIRNNVGTAWRTIRALLSPTAARKKYLDDEGQLRSELTAMQGQHIPIHDVPERAMEIMMANLNSFFPALAAAELAKSRIKRMFIDEAPAVRSRIAYLERGLPDNITIKMGLQMYRLSQFPEIKDSTSADAFATSLQARELSPEFLQAWDSFMDQFGFRGPMEMDPAAPRYYEQPEAFFAQLRTMAENSDPQYNPEVIFERAQAERQDAYEQLLRVAQGKGTRKARSFQKNYKIMLELGSYRESPKYHTAWITDILRRQVLEAAKPLVEAGRLERVSQAFALTMDQFERAPVDPSLDLKQAAWENSRYLRRFRYVREFPRVIDSRGKILRAPRKEAAAGELVGEPISPGVIRGPVKVLHTPDEKPVLPGDILVARATDPGWTPLFLNAGGIVLEVGGILQHGALVAREYGKPCIAGLENATSILTDGQLVELDGANGVVQFV